MNFNLRSFSKPPPADRSESATVSLRLPCGRPPATPQADHCPTTCGSFSGQVRYLCGSPPYALPSAAAATHRPWFQNLFSLNAPIMLIYNGFLAFADCETSFRIFRNMVSPTPTAYRLFRHSTFSRNFLNRLSHSTFHHSSNLLISRLAYTTRATVTSFFSSSTQ